MRIDGGSFDTQRGKLAAGFATARGDGWFALTADRSGGDRDHAGRRAIRFNGNVGIKLTDRIETRFYASINNINQDLPGALTMADALATPRKANACSSLVRRRLSHWVSSSLRRAHSPAPSTISAAMPSTAAIGAVPRRAWRSRAISVTHAAVRHPHRMKLARPMRLSDLERR